jgi:hypothetical protein
MRLLTLTNEQIEREIEKLDKESKAYKKELFKIAWFMRGSLTMEQVYQLDITDREIIGEIIKENLETTQKSGLPFF